MWQQGESLEGEVIKVDSKCNEIVRRIKQLTNY
jgi:hypothetical protein